MQTRTWLHRAAWLLLLGVGAGLARAEDDAPPPSAAKAYGGTPEALIPYNRQGPPARRFFQTAPTFRGPAESITERATSSVRVACFVPKRGPDATLGRHSEQGARLAFEEAESAREAFERPIELIVRDEEAAWGAVANAFVRLVQDEHVVAAIGALDDTNTHVLTRLLLKLELPLVNASGSDPTLTEHNVPWLVRMRPDDRQTSYGLLRRIYTKDGHRRVAVFRGNDRYSRVGIAEFVDGSRRLGHPICLEVRFDAGPADVEAQIARLRKAAPDAIVLWGRAEPAARALSALRRAGLSQPVYGPDRLVDPRFLRTAGSHAEGVIAAHPYDPERSDPVWTAFRRRYRSRYHAEPDEHAAFAYDAAVGLIEAIRQVGPSRTAIRDRLYAAPDRIGVTGPIRLDTTRNNVRPVCFGQVVDGAFRFRSN